MTTFLSKKLISNIENIHPRIHAKKLDKVLGFKIPKIEVKLSQKYRAYDRTNDESNRKQHYQGTQAWIGLHPQVLQTPYCDIHEALKLIGESNINHVVDVGCGYGRVGLVLSVLKKEAVFTGFEIIKKRQEEGLRVFKNLELENAKIELKNVLDEDFKMPIADVYFIYDFSEREDITQILEQLESLKTDKDFYLITRGDRIDFLMKNKFRHVWKKLYSLESSDLNIFSSKNV